MEVLAMPYVIRPPVRKLQAAAFLAVALICALMVPALARADDDDDDSSYSLSACGPVQVSNPFSIFGDYADYSLVEDGHFESGHGDWSRSGAYVVSGNESYYVRSAADDSSLSIRSWGRATSPRFCVDTNYPHFRFFARHSAGTYGLLWVRARWTEDDDVESATLGFLSGSDFVSWAPTEMLPLAEKLDLTDRRRTQHIKLVFTSLAGTWQIDDVYVDPYRR
jgi:hypothetical protein